MPWVARSLDLMTLGQAALVAHRAAAVARKWMPTSQLPWTHHQTMRTRLLQHARGFARSWYPVNMPGIFRYVFENAKSDCCFAQNRKPKRSSPALRTIPSAWSSRTASMTSSVSTAGKAVGSCRLCCPFKHFTTSGGEPACRKFVCRVTLASARTRVERWGKTNRGQSEQTSTIRRS